MFKAREVPGAPEVGNAANGRARSCRSAPRLLSSHAFGSTRACSAHFEDSHRRPAHILGGAAAAV
jgi:hypothetical protein